MLVLLNCWLLLPSRSTRIAFTSPCPSSLHAKLGIVGTVCPPVDHFLSYYGIFTHTGPAPRIGTPAAQLDTWRKWVYCCVAHCTAAACHSLAAVFRCCHGRLGARRNIHVLPAAATA